jgi:ATP-binding cassette, subfamily B, multidrug efflux pump
MFSYFDRLVDPFPKAEPKLASSRFFLFVWECSHGVRALLAGLVIATACIGAFEAALFTVMGRIVDWLGNVPADQWWTTYSAPLLGLAAVVLMSPLLVCLHSMLKLQCLGFTFVNRLRWNFHRLLLGQSMKFFQDDFAGRLSSKVVQTAGAVREFWVIATDMLVFSVIYFGTVLSLLGHFTGVLMLPFAAWLLLYALTVAFFIPRLARASNALSDARSMLVGRVNDAYANITTVKLFSHTAREAGFAREAMQDFVLHGRDQNRYATGLTVANHVLSSALVVSTTGLSLWLWSGGHASIGAVAATTAMALRLSGIAQTVMWQLAQLFDSVGVIQDGIATLSKPVAVADHPQAPPLVVKGGEVHFENVSFGYGGGKQVLHDVELRIQPGEKVGLVGRSGAGKSTLLNLLLRFHDVDRGRILIDRQDLARVSQDSLREQVGMVMQDTSLLHRSIRDNLMYGRPGASDAELQAAIRHAEAEGFISSLVDASGRRGLEALVGERGVKLSGGQRQRIAIARVMLKDAPVLLMDEATSALDSEVEAAIQRSLLRLMAGKTVIVIAHRLSTIAAMDRLIVMDKGRIVEQGNHATLLKNGGLYAKLWAHQSGGFLAV